LKRPTESGGDYWSRPAEALLSELGSRAEGLSSDGAAGRLREFGLNALKARRKTSAWGLFFRQFRSAIIIILLVATALSAVLQDPVTAVIILVIVLGSATLSFTQEYHAGAAAERLRHRLATKVTALRDGREVSLRAEEVVPGDVVLLSAGSLVPADGVVLDARDFHVNEAVLTGETFPVEKEPGTVRPEAALGERTNCVFMGTNVRSGAARVLIVRTGRATAYGQIAGRLALRPPETEFERGIRKFSYLLTEVMLILVLVVFAVNVLFHKPALDSLLFSVALAAGLTPQLLPAIISINLSKGSQAMARGGVIVRRLESIENFGSIDVLCTDKTGTLTEGVVRLDQATDVEGRPSDAVRQYGAVNASLETGLTNPLDAAIVAAAGAPDGVTKVDEIPYDFIRKRVSVVVDDGGARLLITKGAVDNVLAVCDRVEGAAGAVPLDAKRRASIAERYAAWGRGGVRVLGVAVKALEQRATYGRADERDLVFVGFLTFSDQTKHGVREAIRELEDLGVSLKVVTGDSRFVTTHVAQAVGLPTVEVLTGKELAGLNEEARWRAVERASLIAEVDPNQKEQIILALRKMGHVVGYLGDGVNDAPALHAADAGISVDTAVDVAREAADFVLLERDLSVLRQGVELGRRTFANTLKYVFITTSANFGNMFSMAGASLFLPFLPMLPAQILLTNFLTDFPATTIAGDHVDRELVEKPRRWNIRFLRDFMLTFGIVSSAFDYLTFALLLLVFRAAVGEFRTSWFLVSVLTELAVMLVIRTRRPFYKSRPGTLLLLTTSAVGAATFVLVYSPLGGILGLVRPPAGLLSALVGLTIMYVLATEVAKRFFYRRVVMM
jgi:Mg2+-importing ATPase